MRLKILFCLLLLVSSLLCAQDVLPDQLLSQQMSLSSAVRSALNDSKQQMILLENYCDSLQKKLDSLEGLRTQDQQELTQLSNSLTNTMLSFRSASAALESSNRSLELEKEKVNARNKALLWIGIIGMVIILGKVAAFVLYARRIPIPRWLDILL